MTISSTPRPPRACSSRPAILAGVARVLTLGLALGFLGACEGEQRARDASAPPILQTSEVSVRFDVSLQKAPMMSVLAFHATVSGVAPRDVLGIVDPLAAAAPERDCELRDLDLSAGALVAQGGSIELQEIGGIGLALGSFDPAAVAPATGTIIRPFPRLFPDVATVVGGVVAEAGPLPLGALPERVGLLTPASELPLEEIGVPGAPRITSVNGTPLVAGARVDAHDGLTITISGGPGTIVELRPFGATVAVSCAVPDTASASGESTLIVPRALIARLSGGTLPSSVTSAGSDFPASLDVLRRARVRVGPFAVTNHLSIEVRAATAVELRP